MRNDTNNWDTPKAPDTPIIAAGVTVARIELARQTIVSGTDVLHVYDTSLGPAVGWPEAAQGPSYAIALRRDRVLLVGGPPVDDGWHATTGHAVSDMTGGYAVFELSGPAVPDLLKRGAAITPHIPSRSAVRRFAEMDVVLYHWGDQNRIRIHVDAAHQWTVWQVLQSYLHQMDPS